ncbi:hypothetical protein ABW21_db0202906 [Orbilia brochopaga]|nr:hypothetical protein ABW21_db0202906 [Drechslerella brochopaga]
MTSTEANQDLPDPGRPDARPDDEVVLIDSAPATGTDTPQATRNPGRPPLATSLKRKSSTSRADIEVANANSTLDVFLSGIKHSWMQGDPDYYTSRTNINIANTHIPTIKRVKTAPTKPAFIGRRPEAQSNPQPPNNQTVPVQEQQQRIVITIPDTQPDQIEPAAPQAPSPNIEELVPAATSSSTPMTVEYTGPHILGSSTSIIQESTPVVRSLSSAAAPNVRAELATSTVQSRSRPAPINTRIPTRITVPSGPSSFNVERMPHAVPTNQPTVSGFMQNITPPPSMSPVVAAGYPGTSESIVRPASTLPTPVSSPQMSDPTVIHVPMLRPDGSCELHTVNLRKPTKRDLDLLMQEHHRVTYDFQNLPNPSLGARKLKIARGLEILRSRLNKTNAQPPQEVAPNGPLLAPNTMQFSTTVASQSGHPSPATINTSDFCPTPANPFVWRSTDTNQYPERSASSEYALADAFTPSQFTFFFSTFSMAFAIFYKSINSTPASASNSPANLPPSSTIRPLSRSASS